MLYLLLHVTWQSIYLIIYLFAGVTIRFDRYSTTDENLCRVMSVEEDSPAELAGLMNDGSDFILGSAEKVCRTW